MKFPEDSSKTEQRSRPDTSIKDFQSLFTQKVQSKAGTKSPQNLVRGGGDYYKDKLQTIQILKTRGTRSFRSMESKMSSEWQHKADNSTTSIFARNLTERLRINPIFHLSKLENKEKELETLALQTLRR